MSRVQRHDIITASGFAAVLLAALAVFWPALTGPFIFDDIANLRALGDDGGITNLGALWDLLRNDKFPLGRPIAFLTFAMNDQYWPAVSWPFKYTNLLIHTLNGVLVFMLARRLARLTPQGERHADLMAVVLMAVWLLHPLQLSTMMLVVQRMVELMALFTLAGLLAFLRGRTLVASQPLRGYLWMSGGIGLGGILAVLSKENGILLAVYALVLEFTLIRAAGLPRPPYWRQWAAVFLVAPLIALAGYFVLTWDEILQKYAYKRDFTLIERLMTEPRILFDYLRRILIPSIGGSGIFHDDYLISRGLLSPLTTLPAIIGIGALAVIGFATRRRIPVLSFAILWFLGGHLLESTFVPLEVYFEHRNYLPMIGPLFALTYLALRLATARAALVGIAIALYIGMAGVLSYNASLAWGDADRLAAVTVRENPESMRAQQLAAKQWSQRGNYERALRHLYAATEHNPRTLDPKLQIIQLQCLTGELDSERIDRTVQALDTGKFDNGVFETYRRLINLAEQDTCKALDYESLHRIANALLSNRRYTLHPHSEQALRYMQGKVYANQGNLPDAMTALDQAFELKPDVNIPLLQAKWLVSAGLYDEALEYVERARKADKGFLKGTSQRDDIRNMRRLIMDKKGDHDGE